jgi:hypothetical protein
MKNLVLALIAGAAFLLFYGCSPVKFYSNPRLTEKTGIKYYTVKPFLLAERDTQADRIVKATVLYLPDLASPQYMSVKDGLGSRKVDLKLTDGAINTFGLTTDTKIAASLAALASLLSKGTSAITDLNTLKAVPGAGATSTITELYEIFMSPAGTTLKKIEFK